jgi:hypothetical protein
MGMTIDDHIEVLRSYYNGFTGQAGNLQESIDVAIDIMGRYQKIQEILRWNDAPSPYYKPDGQLFREICEVIEYGNNAGND